MATCVGISFGIVLVLGLAIWDLRDKLHNERESWANLYKLMEKNQTHSPEGD